MQSGTNSGLTYWNFARAAYENIRNSNTPSPLEFLIFSRLLRVQTLSSGSQNQKSCQRRGGHQIRFYKYCLLSLVGCSKIRYLLHLNKCTQYNTAEVLLSSGHRAIWAISQLLSLELVIMKAMIILSWDPCKSHLHSVDATVLYIPFYQ